MVISRSRLSTCSYVPMGPCSRLSYVIASVQVNGPMQLLIASLLTVLVVIRLITVWTSPSTSYPTGYGLDSSVGIQRGSRWTIEVQRLLQPTRELVKSEYEARVESQGTVITR